MPPRSRRLRQRQQQAEAEAEPELEQEPEPELEPEIELDDDDLGGVESFDEAGDDEDFGPESFEAPSTEPVSRRSSRRGSAAGGRGTSRRRRGRGGTGEVEDAPAAPSGRSSRRSSARGSKRKSKRQSARKELTPEERAARKATIRNTLITLLLIVVVGGGGAGAYLALKEEPRSVEVELDGEGREFTGTRAQLARQFMDLAGDARDALEKALDARQPDVAKAYLENMVNLLRTPVLGGGTTPNPEDQNIGDMGLAMAAVDLLGEVDDYDQRITRLKEDRRARANFDRLKARLAELRDPDLDLDVLETDMRRFIENPVRPEEGTNPDFQARYKTSVDEIAANIHEITSERLARLITDTTKVVETINLKSQEFIARKQYGTALSLVDEAARNFPQADLKPVRQKVLSAAERGWEADRIKAENDYKDAVAPGVGEAVRTKKLREAIETLEYAVANYGRDVREIRGYVEEAERLLRQVKAKL